MLREGCELMTTKEKLDKALEALKRIKNNDAAMPREYAAQVYSELTAPKMETVRSVYWLYVSPRGEKTVCETVPETGEQGCQIVKMISEPYQRPVEEKEPEVWEGKVEEMASTRAKGMARYLPSEFIGKTVEVRLKEAE